MSPGDPAGGACELMMIDRPVPMADAAAQATSKDAAACRLSMP